VPHGRGPPRGTWPANGCVLCLKRRSAVSATQRAAGGVPGDEVSTFALPAYPLLHLMAAKLDPSPRPAAAASSRPWSDQAAVGLEEDRALLDGFRTGDRAALQEVFKRYLPVVVRALRGGARTTAGGARLEHGLDEMELENLAHDTFVRAFAPAARERYDGLRPYSAYIATIAKNLLIDEARKRRRRPGAVALEDAPPIAADEGEVSPARHAEAKVLREVVARFTAELPDEEQAIFNARFVEQLSLRQASRALGISMFALRRIDARLRLDLLAALREAGFLEHADVRVGRSVLERGTQKGAS
jgi:RNA polymerase sigma factor (sigma-70 family)